jgi:hypothetical protein
MAISANPVFFADDTSMIVTNITKRNRWFQSNSLSLNIDTLYSVLQENYSKL